MQIFEKWNRRIILFCILIFLSINIDAQIITTIAGGGTAGLGDGGPATDANISWFASVVVDSHGDFYVADGNHQRVRKVNTTTGIITTFAGTGTAGYNGDNIPAINAQLNYPLYLAFDTNGNLYISDNGNYRIRKVNIATGIITTYVGTGVSGYNGDGIPANTAQIKGLQDLSFDPFGNLYFVDGMNYRIRKVNTAGIISTVAGNGIKDVTGNGGPAIAASISSPLGIGTDKHGNVYFNDSPAYVRKIDVSSGVISIVAGSGIGMPYNGDEIPVLSANIGTFDIAFDTANNMYLADFDNNRIRKVDTGGIIHTIAGNGVGAFGGDSGPADSAQIHGPEGLTVDQCGNVYIADFGNKRVRKVTYMPVCNPAGVAEVGAANSIGIYPNPVSDMLTITSSSIINEVILVNVLGQALIKQNPRTNKEVLDVTTLQSGVYFVRVINRLGEVLVRRFIKP